MLSPPDLLCFTVNPSLFIFAIPKLHIHGHRLPCQAMYSLKYLFGPGQTDGEGIERTWAMMGPVATSTKEMGPGHRHDTLDDHWSYWNWSKLIGLGMSFVYTPVSLDILIGPLLKRRLENAITELVRQEEAFNSFSLNQAEQVPEWKAALEKFENDPTAKSPFIHQNTGMHAEVTYEKLNIGHAVRSHSTRYSDGTRTRGCRRSHMSRGCDKQQDVTNRVPGYYVSIGRWTVCIQWARYNWMTFISRIQLRHTAKDLGSSPTSKRNADLLTCRNCLVRQITSLCEIQATYIPGTHTVLQALQKAKSKDGKPSLLKPSLSSFPPTSLSLPNVLVLLRVLLTLSCDSVMPSVVTISRLYAIS